MKNALIISAAALAFSLSSCDDSAGRKVEETVQSPLVDSSKYTAVDLRKYNIDRTILVESGTPGREEIQQTATGNIEITAGERYAVVIVPNPLNLQEKKSELEADPLYQISYVEESPDHILYSKEITDSGIPAEFHFYILLDDGNETIAVQSSEMVQLKKEKAETILESFKIQKKTPA